MQRYEVKESIGDGTFGRVFRCINKSSGKVVAIKKLKRKFSSWDETLKLSELQCLKAISCSHPNIIKLHEVLREGDRSLYFVFEHMKDGNLYELISTCGLAKRKQQYQSTSNSSTPNYLSKDKVQSIAYQILSGLSHLHKSGYIHRDIKPENVLLSGDVCKLADFGLAKLTSARGNFTDYVSTRWYRAPEVLMRSSRYGPSIDLFAVGCIISETFTLLPLFPGGNEVDQIHKLLHVLGPPSLDLWPEGLDLFQKNNIRIPTICRPPSSATNHSQQLHLEKHIPQAPSEARTLIQDLLQYNPKLRPSATSALKYEYFSNVVNSPQHAKLLCTGAHSKDYRTNGPSPKINTTQPVSVSPNEMSKNTTPRPSPRETFLAQSSSTLQNRNDPYSGGKCKHFVQDSPTLNEFIGEGEILAISTRTKYNSQRCFKPKLTNNPYLRKPIYVPPEDKI